MPDRKPMDDEQKASIASKLAILLEAQLSLSGSKTPDSKNGGPKPKVLGYVYGYIDAALRTDGWETDLDICVPIAFQVFRHLWPDKEREYVEFLTDHLDDPVVVAACATGGEEQLNSTKLQTGSNVSWSLVRYVLADD
jgi:hypothetical protein